MGCGSSSGMPAAPGRSPLLLCAAGLAALSILGPACRTSTQVGLPAPRVRVIETAPLHIDRIYTSMAGPYDRTVVDTADLDWVTAFRSEVIDARTGRPMSDEYFCHSQLQLRNGYRLMLGATGIADVRFPDGFGMPVGQILGSLPDGDRMVTFLGMVLNNHQATIDRFARVRATLEYWTDEEVGDPPRLKKLYRANLIMAVEDLEAYTPDPGEQVNEDVTTHCVLVEGERTHWIVPPGRQVTRKRYRNVAPVDGTVHYGVVHLHNHAVSMSLTDVTAGRMLWRTDVVHEANRRQIQRIPVYSSAEGFPLLADHEYEIEVVYDNTSGGDVDAMAMMSLYYHPAGGENITYPRGPEG